MNFQVGQRVWEKDFGGDGKLRGGMVIDVIELTKKLVVVEAHGIRRGKAAVDVTVLNFGEIDMAMVEETGPHERGKLVRVLLRRMGERNHALRTQEDERDIAAIDALWSA
jgi:hypothetical protein